MDATDEAALMDPRWAARVAAPAHVSVWLR
jgi:hypothetical protein